MLRGSGGQFFGWTGRTSTRRRAVSTSTSALDEGVPPPPDGPPRSVRRDRASRGDRRLAVWLIVPTVLALGLVVGYPIVRALYRSFFDDPIGGTPAFVGFENYTDALWGADSDVFWESLQVTVFFTVVSVGLEVLLGFSMALVMHRALRGRGLIRTSVLVPWAIPTAVTAVMWGWILEPNGVLNHLIGQEILWTGSEWPAKWAIIFADVWKTAPFVALLLLAGLQIIPDELYEAAKVDGASAWRRFVEITLPMVKPALMVAVLFRMLDVLRIYDLPAILTNGANDTTTLSILVVETAIGNLEAGYGSALSTLTFLFIFLCAYLFVKLLGTNVIATQQREVK
ncbi:MAG: carbohydrate ABC transporter permease [Actinomycetes bacterium]